PRPGVSGRGFHSGSAFLRAECATRFELHWPVGHNNGLCLSWSNLQIEILIHSAVSLEESRGEGGMTLARDGRIGDSVHERNGKVERSVNERCRQRQSGTIAIRNASPYA